MAKYREQSVTTNEYIRSRRVIVTNNLNEPPKVDFFEELVQQVDALPPNVRQLPGSLSEVLTPANAAQSFPVIDFVTLSPTGNTATFGDVGNILTSLYYHLATKRDAP